MSNPINVFIIYSREDKGIKQRLLAHLNPLKNPYNLVIWHDDYIEPGQQWKPHIESKLEQTDLFLLLVSVDFMNSKFIHQVEFQFAVNRHKENKSILIPLIINYCQWDIDISFKDYDFNLSELQVLPDEGKPIDDWRTSEQAYNNIAGGIRKVLASIRNKWQNEVEEQHQKLIKEKEQKQIEEERQIKAEEKLQQENIEKEKKRDLDEQAKLKEAEEEKQRTIDEEVKRKETEEEEFWKSVNAEHKIELFQKYLYKYPNGKYTDFAKTQIDSLKESSEEEQFWNKLDHKSIIPLKEYLVRYPKGKYYKTAESEIEVLRKNEEGTQREKEEQYWEDLDHQSIEALSDYSLRYPSGRFCETAKSELAVLIKSEEERLKLEKQKRQQEVENDRKRKEDEGNKIIEIENGEMLQQEEDGFWQKVITGDTIGSFKKYLNTYPDGKYSNEALANISNLRKIFLKRLATIFSATIVFAFIIWWVYPWVDKTKAYNSEKLSWVIATDQNDSSAYSHYLLNYPNGIWEKIARQKLDSIINVKQSLETRLKDQQAWNIALNKNDSTSYVSYLQNFPTGQYRNTAQQKLDSIIQARQSLESFTKDNEARQSLENITKDNQAWNTALSTNTISGFQNYRKEFPKGEHYDDAMVKGLVLARKLVAEKLAIGFNYKGGIVFYIDETGEHGLVCAPKDQGSNISWCNGCFIENGQPCNISPIGGLLPDLNKGASNTSIIVNSLGAGNYAADLCQNLVFNGYNDWFLPSQDELILMFKNLKPTGKIKFNEDAYWSSTERIASNTSCTVFVEHSNGSNSKNLITNKWAKCYVRAVRAF